MNALEKSIRKMFSPFPNAWESVWEKVQFFVAANSRTRERTRCIAKGKVGAIVNASGSIGGLFPIPATAVIAIHILTLDH